MSFSSYSTVVWVDDPFFIKRQRVQMACSFCRQRKIKCDGRNPCANCKKYSNDCTYVKVERQPRNKPFYSKNGQAFMIMMNYHFYNFMVCRI
ncbi:hypothetical protein C1646_681529 [Rhizophagus diaphanus]|nr:hypothetical protein C1646_681529 [Rhizophagus diaphanus] [Rhizophagus sp. MUCL 43196]